MTYVYPLLSTHFINIGIALAIGLMVGSERDWHNRDAGTGSRVAGIRTFSLVALLGGVVGATTSSLPEFQRWLICGLAFVPVATLLIVGYLQTARQWEDLGITTEIAAMLTFWLGVLPGFGYALTAAATGVVVALLLHLKEQLHNWLKFLDGTELLGTLQFLLISVVTLPMLPNRGFGPWQFFNPYQIWWMVVLISGLSLMGYFATRVAGSRKGVLATSLTGGLVSSTAVTMSLSRLHREIGNTDMVAAGILLACGTMFCRMLILVAVLDWRLVLPLLPALGTGFVVLLGMAWWRWRSGRSSDAAGSPEIHNPFQLAPALQFAGLLALVMLGAEALQVQFGDAGLYALSFFTGLADVDAIVLSLATKDDSGPAFQVIVLSIAIAAATNTLMKGIYCRAIAGSALGWRVLIPNTLSALLVITAAGITLWL